MDKLQQLHILYLQIAAGFLMSLDYFMPAAYRAKIDSRLGHHVETLRKVIYQDLVEAKAIFFQRRQDVVLRVLVFLLCVVCLCYEKYWAIATVPYLNFAISVFGIISMLWLLKVFFQILEPVIFPLITAGPVSALLYFISKSGRGPLAAFGMLCLALSFLLRYLALNGLPG